MRTRSGLLCAVLLLASASGALTGCAGRADSAPTSPAPSASAAAAATPRAQPDLSIRRTVALADGSTTTICLTATVKRDSGTEDSQTDARLVQARAIVTDPTWQTYPVSLSQVPTDEQQRDRARGEDDAVILAGVLSNAISDAVRKAGLLGEGVSLAGHVGCQ